MSRYLLLFILNAPFVIFGITKSILYYKEKVYGRHQLIVRLIFWLGCLFILIFTKPIYDFFRGNNLTNSPPLSIADVLLATFCFFSLTMIIRLYARLEKAEQKLTELNEALALKQNN